MPRTFSQPPPRPKIERKRRGIRMNSRVPVALEWQDERGSSFREKTFTRVIGPYGCLVVVPKGLSLEQRVRLVNLATEQGNEAVVRWKGAEQSEGWELGIELTQPPLDFWGFDL